MKASEALRLTAARIATPERWTQGNMGVALGDDTYCNPDNAEITEAHRLCAMRAMGVSCGAEQRTFDVARDFFLRAIDDGKDPCICVRFNDSHTHAEVIAALTKAAELAESEGQ